jgi:hypothetical protein
MPVLSLFAYVVARIVPEHRLEDDPKDPVDTTMEIAVGYFLDVYLDRVVCRNPESLTTGDFFALYGEVITDSDVAPPFVEPIRVLRSNETFAYHRKVFSGYAKAPTVGLLIRAWDKDLNSAWVKNEEDIKDITNEIADAIKAAPVFGTIGEEILDFAVNYSLTVTDILVAQDTDDLLVDRRDWIPLDNPGFNQRVLEHELRFSRSDPTGFSDWDYSLFLTIVYYEASPQFGTTIPPVWADFNAKTRPSLIDNWIGNWSSAEASPGVHAKITAGTRRYTLDVIITERGHAGFEMTSSTTGIPISRVFVEAGHRELEVAGNPFQIDYSTVGSNLASNSVSPLSRFLIESEHGGGAITRTSIYSEVATPTSVILKQQIGTDVLILNDQVILEAYRILRDGTDFGEVGLRYLRPVTNVLYREIGAEVAVLLSADADV